MKGERFRKRQRVFVFERGIGRFVASSGYDVDRAEEMLNIAIDDDCESFPSSLCFAFKRGRIARQWAFGDSAVEVSCDPIAFTYRGPTKWVTYSPEEREYFEDGDRLHADWDGYGIDFAALIEKWLLRLAGHQIPLSSYYRDPINRWLDSFGDADRRLQPEDVLETFGKFSA